MIRLLPFKPVRLLVTLLFVLSLGSVTAQTAEIRGKITDQAGNPVVGASVIVKGTTTGTTSLSDGSFALDAAPGATLQIMMLGYKSAEQAVTKAASFYEITLTEDSQLMEDVVVVGYGHAGRCVADVLARLSVPCMITENCSLRDSRVDQELREAGEIA